MPAEHESLPLTANHADLAYVLGLTALASISAAIGIAHRSLWLDELLSFYYARPDVALSAAVDTWKMSDHLPTYYVTLRAWNEVLGQSQIASRLMSLLGLLLTAAFAVPYRTLLSPRHFRVFTAMLLLSPAVVYYAGEARMYIFLIAGSAAVFHHTYRKFEEPEIERLGALLPLALATILLSLVDYFGLVFAVSSIVILLVRQFSWHRVVSVPLLALLAALFVMPIAWTWFAWSQLHGQTGGRAWLHFQLWRPIFGFGHLLFGWNVPLIVAALAGTATNFRSIARMPILQFAVAVAGLYFSIVFLFSLHTPVLTFRTFLVVAVPALVIASAGVEGAIRAATRMWPRWSALVTPTAVALIAATFVQGAYTTYHDYESWKAPALVMAQKSCAGAEILTDVDDADVPNTSGAFLASYYFLHELHVPSPAFLPLNRVSKLQRRRPGTCAVKVFEARGHLDADTAWVMARRVLGATATYRTISFTKTYLLLDSPAK